MEPPLASFQQAFERLLRLAPGPLFPRARSLYFHKYSLEDPSEVTLRHGDRLAEGGSLLGRFRTFLLQEDIEEAPAGLQRIRAVRFALVHWQGPQTDPAVYSAYLQQRWQLPALDLCLAEDCWFRDAGAYASFRAAAERERLISASFVAGPKSPDGSDHPASS